jgi:hypothetical protein
MTKGGKNNTQKRRSGKKHQTGGWPWSKPADANSNQETKKSSGLFSFFSPTPKPADANPNDEKKNTRFWPGWFGRKKSPEAPKDTQNPLTDETDKKTTTTNDTKNTQTGNDETNNKTTGGKRKNKTAKRQHKKHHKK